MTITEASVESAVTALLQTRGWLVLPLNAERPQKGKAARRQAMPGTPDLVALKDGRGVLIECKRPGGKRRRSQDLFTEYAAKHGVAVVLADDARAVGGLG